MKRPPAALWSELAARHPAPLVERYRERLDGPDPFFEEPRDEPARRLLDELFVAGYVEAEERPLCPSCGRAVGEAERAARQCTCGFSFEHDEPTRSRVYARRGLRSRDPLWVVTVHGMNTRGPWQEEFSWKLAQIYGYAVPVAIYKYGRLLVSPFLLLRQERYTRLLEERLRKLRAEMTAGGYGERPDVIAHSFGTWLLARALHRDPELRLGRVVLTGAIVPPDFDWAPFLEGDPPRVEAVLCHHGGRDGVVPLAQFFIRRSGPSGRRGFNPDSGPPGRLLHRFAPGFGHSDYFAPAHLGRVMDEVWGPFLTLPDAELIAWGDRREAAARWRRSRLGAVTHLVKYAVLGALALLVPFLLLAVVLGVDDVLRSFRDLF
jgi:pimeloyl-ACP methyl ester carboxylesterase